MAVERQPPDVVAMILADTVLQDLSTGKLFIKGTFSVLNANDFPGTYTFAVYTAFTGGHGPTHVELRLVDVDEENDPLVASSITIDFQDPLAVVETVFTLNGVTFHGPGEFWVQLYGAGQLLRERRLQVIAPKDPLGS